MTRRYRYEVIMSATGYVEADGEHEAEAAAMEDAVDSVMVGSPHVTYDVTVQSGAAGLPKEASRV